jgi:hypothetical protein
MTSMLFKFSIDYWMQSNLSLAVDVTVTNATVASVRGENVRIGIGIVTAETAGSVSVGSERSVSVGNVKSARGGSVATVAETERDMIMNSSNVIVNATAAMSKSNSILH